MGHLVGTLAQLKRTLICHVYFLLSLSNHEHRRGRSSEASEYLMLAVKLFTTPPLNPEQQLQPWLASAEQAPGVAQAEQVVEAADAHVHGNGVLRNRYVFDPDDLLLPDLHGLTPGHGSGPLPDVLDQDDLPKTLARPGLICRRRIGQRHPDFKRIGVCHRKALLLLLLCRAVKSVRPTYAPLAP